MHPLLSSLDKAHSVTAEIFGGLKSDQWQLSTPCHEWNVQHLANHMVGGYRLFSAALTSSTAEETSNRTGWERIRTQRMQRPPPRSSPPGGHQACCSGR